MTPLSPQPHQSDPRRQPAALLKDLANISVHDTSSYINIHRPIESSVLSKLMEYRFEPAPKKGPRNFPEAITFSSIPLSDHHQPISICYGGSTIGRGSMSIIGTGLTLNINYNEKVNQYDHYMTNRRGPIRATISAGGLCLTLVSNLFYAELCFLAL